ncbi:MAG: M20 family metallopeptidase [Salibacteraceae bacterium]
MIKDEISALAKELFEKVIQHRRYLHRHPELSFQEHNTAAYVAGELSRMGLSPVRVADTGVVAHIAGKDGDRVVALRADMDALPITEQNEVDYRSENPGVMHACGHDVHTASLLGVAELLTRMKDEFSGTVKLIFQPGEEKLPGGATLMIKEGVLEDPRPQSILGQHVYPELEAGKVGFKAGKYMASADEVYLTVEGKGGHAAMPHLLNDPVFAAANIITSLQQVISRRANPVVPSVLSFGKVLAHGATNVVPSEVFIEGTFRTFDEDWRNNAIALIEEIAKTTAAACGVKCKVDIKKGYPHLHNDERLTIKMQGWATEMLGAENVVDLDYRMTAEDFSFYTHIVPGCFYRLGTRSGANGRIESLHNPNFDIDERALFTGVQLMSFLCIKQLNT